MNDRVIAIITDWSSELGSGHVQRMISLADFINHQPGFRAIIVNEKPLSVPGAPQTVTPAEFRSSAIDRIVRDQRDSSVSDIVALRTIAPVIAVDDHGEGRYVAQRVIDLLPHPSHRQNRQCYRGDLFLYGYSFTQSVSAFNESMQNEPIDAALYLGHDPNPDDIAWFRSLLPPHCRCVVLAGSYQLLFHESQVEKINEPYVSLLMASRVLITHFGITLYEGFLAGCRLLTINPGIYHAELADMASAQLGLVNLGIRQTLDREKARTVIAASLEKPKRTVRHEDISRRCVNNLSSFFQVLVS